MTIENTEQEIIKLSNKWDLFRLSTRGTRFAKVCEEFEELTDELFPPDGRAIDFDKVEMEAGDLLVTIVNLLHPEGLSAAKAIARAHEKNLRKKGRMVDGTFKKEEP